MSKYEMTWLTVINSQKQELPRYFITQRSRWNDGTIHPRRPEARARWSTELGGYSMCHAPCALDLIEWMDANRLEGWQLKCETLGVEATDKFSVEVKPRRNRHEKLSDVLFVSPRMRLWIYGSDGKENEEILGGGGGVWLDEQL